MENARSTLMAFFDYNTANEDGRNHLYHDFPQDYVFHSKEREWRRRKRGDAIGRMYFCNPSAGEKYYLRLLLTTVRGPKSFEDIRTVNGVVHPTFQAACKDLGLLDDDEEWRACFEESAVFSSGRALRVLFTTALIYGPISDP